VGLMQCAAGLHPKGAVCVDSVHLLNGGFVSFDVGSFEFPFRSRTVLYFWTILIHKNLHFRDVGTSNAWTVSTRGSCFDGRPGR
jgi:hypothetical protein